MRMREESGMDLSMKFLNDWRSDVEMGHSLLLNGNVDGEPIVLGNDRRLNGCSAGIED